MVYEWKDIVILVLLGIVAVQAFGLHRSIPPGVAKLIFEFGRSKAAETPQAWDDRAVDEGEKLYNKLVNSTDVTNSPK